jgi:hypothetical protein
MDPVRPWWLKELSPTDQTRVEGILDVLRLEVLRVRARRDHYAEALQSISRNRCCERCQEAALVAEKALTSPASPIVEGA